MITKALAEYLEELAESFRDHKHCLNCGSVIEEIQRKKADGEITILYSCVSCKTLFKGNDNLRRTLEEIKT